MAWFWLSFADANLPEGSQFLGGCVVQGGGSGDLRTDLAEALREAWRQGCNPGGEVRSQEIMPSIEVHIHPRWRNRLLTRAEAEDFGREIAPHGVS